MKTDVAIIGGGLAGLALADALHADGIDFQLFEARNRFGGRIKTANQSGAAFDLGPAWFWQGQPRMAAAAKRFGLTVFEQFSVGDVLAEDQNGTVRRGAGFASMAGSLRIEGGVTALIDGFVAALPAGHLHLNQTAVGLTSTVDGVTIQTEDMTIAAKTVILSVPPRITAQIKFDPPLDVRQRNAMHKIPTWMAGQAKYIGVYDTPIWRDAGLSGDAQSRRGPMVEIHDASPHKGGPYAVFGFIGFDAQTRATHRAEMGEMATEQLTRLFGAKPDQLILQDWAGSPHTATTADFVATGHPAYGRPSELEDIWGGKITLGSSEMGATFGGYLEGALEAAQDVGQTLIAGRKL